MTAVAITGAFAGSRPALVSGVARPDVAAVKEWMTIESTLPVVDSVLSSVLSVATEQVLSRCVDFVIYDEVLNSVTTTDLVPQTVAQAIIMQTARWYRRRNSVSGFEGYGEIGFVRVGVLDNDIEQMVMRWLGHDFA